MMRILILLASVALIGGTRAPTFSPTALSRSPTVIPSMYPTFVPTLGHPDCPRLPKGSDFVNPVNLTSRHGYLDAYLNYRKLDVRDLHLYPHENGSFPFRYCYMITSGEHAGEQAPVLRASPGETMLVTLTNDLDYEYEVLMTIAANDYCLERVATTSSTNMHFHGFHSQPVCQDDNVVMTIVNSHQSFTYVINIPTSQPPGLYWYHPHMHTVADDQVSGGASGVMVIEGIENVQPEVAGLPEQIMVFRRGNYISLNFIEITGVQSPVQMKMKPLQKQFWRIANTMADSELNLTLSYDGVFQSFRVIALDGVPVGVNQTVSSFDKKCLFLPTGGRVEVIVTGPALGQSAMLHTAAIDFNLRPSDDVLYNAGYQILQITADTNAANPTSSIPNTLQPATSPSPRPTGRVPENILAMQPAAEHTLTFYAEADPPAGIFKWFVNVDDEPYQVFDINADPAIVGTQGTVEDWTIINNTTENHDFHIHQMHFIVLEIDGIPVAADQKQYRDMVMLPHQTPNPAHNPGAPMQLSHSVKIRVDFTGDVVGKFVFHCHILFHEDHGMMRIVEVVAPDATIGPSAAPSRLPTMLPSVVPSLSSPVQSAGTNSSADDDDGDSSDSSVDVGLYIAIGVLGGAVLIMGIGMIYCFYIAGSSRAVYPGYSAPGTTPAIQQANTNEGGGGAVVQMA